jgi:hypothetical protein
MPGLGLGHRLSRSPVILDGKAQFRPRLVAAPLHRGHCPVHRCNGDAPRPVGCPYRRKWYLWHCDSTAIAAPGQPCPANRYPCPPNGTYTKYSTPQSPWAKSPAVAGHRAQGPMAQKYRSTGRAAKGGTKWIQVLQSLLPANVSKAKAVVCTDTVLGCANTVGTMPGTTCAIRNMRL